LSPLEVTLEQALDLLAKPKPGRGAARRSEPIRVFEVSPVTGQPVQLLSGRYGPYVTDGATNASLPKTLAPEEVTFERAVELLAERAAKGPAKRAARRTYTPGPARATSSPAKKKAVPRKKQRSRK
jgi:DNA topoisomerase-1